MLIYLIGLPGVGKSYLGKKLSQKLNYQFVDLDEQIEKSVGLTIPEIFEYRGEDYFRDIENEELKKTILLKDTVIACGGGTPCYYDNIELMNKAGKTVFLDSSIEQILANLSSQPERPLLKGNEKESLDLLIAKRKEDYNKASLRVEVNSKAIESIFSALDLQKG